MSNQSKFSKFKDWADREWDGVFPIDTATNHAFIKLQIAESVEDSRALMSVWHTVGLIKFDHVDHFGAWYKIVG